MKTIPTVTKVETNSKYYPVYHLTFDDYRGVKTIKIDEQTARLLVTMLDEAINCFEKIKE